MTRQSYAACPRPRRVTNTHAVWAKPSGEPGIIAGAMLLAAVFAIITLGVATIPSGRAGDASHSSPAVSTTGTIPIAKETSK